MQNECINPEESLVELYRRRDTIRRKIKMARFVNDVDAEELLGKEYQEITTRIKKVEDVGYNGGGVIRLM